MVYIYMVYINIYIYLIDGSSTGLITANGADHPRVESNSGIKTNVSST